VEETVSEARAEILECVKRAIGGAQPAEVARTYRRAGALDADERADLFRARVDEYRAEVRRVADIGAAIVDVCAERGVRRLALPPELPTQWRPPGVEVVEDHGLTARELDRVDGALTGCTAAIAETGTIILTAGPTEGRRALTLVPDLHICVVREEQICELVPEALERLRAKDLARRPITFVSGPSATSDIELSRVEGVHGPRNLVVLITKEQAWPNDQRSS
jgi:L-lactate dehydrogenase complex protein LldG